MFHKLAIILVVLLGSQVFANDFLLNYEAVDIRKLTKDMAQMTQKTIVLDPRVKGNISVYSEVKLDVNQVWEVYLRTLQVNGFSAVETNGVTRIIPENEAVRDQGADTHSGALTAKVMPLKYRNAKNLVSDLRPLIGRKGYLSSIESVNALLIVDYGSNVKRIQKILNQLDADSLATLKMYPLKQLSVFEAIRILDDLSDVKKSKLSGFKAIPFIQNNAVIVSANPFVQEKIAALFKQLEKDALEDNSSGIIYLKYAKAEDVVKVLEKVAQNYSDKKAGRVPLITFHPLTNSIVISADQSVFKRLKKIVDRLDIRRAQVLVEAIIVELSESAANSLGVQTVSYGQDKKPLGFTRFNSTSPDLVATTAAVLEEGSSTLDQIAVDSLLSSQGLVLGGGAVNLQGDSFIGILNAIREDQDSELLSTPSIIALDNEEASLVIGQEIPVTTGESLGANNSTPFRTTSRQEVGIKLKITPQINEGNAVMLKINQEASSVQSALSSGDFITNKREIETSVLVENNQILVLGGLISEDITENVSKVPILGSIPILGLLFQSSKKQKVKRKLMVFLKPRILNAKSDLSQISAEKYSLFKAAKTWDSLNKIHKKSQ